MPFCRLDGAGCTVDDENSAQRKELGCGWRKFHVYHVIRWFESRQCPRFVSLDHIHVHRHPVWARHNIFLLLLLGRRTLAGSFPFCLESSKVGQRWIFAVGHIRVPPLLIYHPSWLAPDLLRRIEWRGWLGWTRRFFLCSCVVFFYFYFSHDSPQYLGERKAPACLVRPYSLKAAANPLHTHAHNSTRALVDFLATAAIRRHWSKEQVEKLHIDFFPSKKYLSFHFYLWCKHYNAIITEGRSLFRSLFWRQPMRSSDGPPTGWLALLFWNYSCIKQQHAANSLLLSTSHQHRDFRWCWQPTSWEFVHRQASRSFVGHCEERSAISGITLSPDFFF